MDVPTSTAEFLQVVRDSGLIDAIALDRILDGFRGGDGLPVQPRRFASRLVRDGLLTPFQAEQLLLGHWHVFTIGKYKILDQLGTGSTGIVYLVEQPDLGRRVAVKVLPLSSDAGPSVVQRFRREARALALLDHPHVVHIYDFDQAGDKLFLVMEYVEGVTLHDWVRRNGRLGVTHACHYARQAARGLQAVHEAGLVHRDVKPNNIMLDAQGQVRILDLGLARFLGDEGDSPTVKYDSKRVLGTADYLSPEQAVNSHEVDVRADVYSLGATFHFFLTGQPPFPTGTVVQKLLWVQTREPQPVHEVNPEVPPELSEVVARMMAKDPAQRYATPFEVVKALARWTATPVEPPDLGHVPSHRRRHALPTQLDMTPLPGAYLDEFDGPEPHDDLTPIQAPQAIRNVTAWAEPDDPSSHVELGNEESSEPGGLAPWIPETVSASAPTPPPRMTPPKMPRVQRPPAPRAAAPPEPDDDERLSWPVAAVIMILMLAAGVGALLLLTFNG